MIGIRIELQDATTEAVQAAGLLVAMVMDRLLSNALPKKIVADYLPYVAGEVSLTNTAAKLNVRVYPEAKATRKARPVLADRYRHQCASFRIALGCTQVHVA